MKFPLFYNSEPATRLTKKASGNSRQKRSKKLANKWQPSGLLLVEERQIV